MGEVRNAYKILAGKPERKRPLGISIRRLADNIRMVLREMGWEGVDWIHLDQGRNQGRATVSTVMNLRGSIKGGKFLD
jgi:hypothetical protein